MNFHITPDGPRPCVARKRACKYEDHYESREEADASYSEKMLNLSGVRSETPGAKSAAVSRAYAHWSILNNHLHNCTTDIERMEDAELAYFASEQGLLELKRRSAGGDKTYLEIEKAVRAGNFKKDVLELNEAEVLALAEEGAKTFPRDFEEFYAQYDQPRDLYRVQRHALVEKSYEWLKKLTPEEQESVSWATSNGFRLLQYLDENSRKDDRDFFFNFKDYVDEDAIYKKESDPDEAEWQVQNARRSYAENYRNTLMGAIKKAPKLPEPVVIARGTSPLELKSILGVSLREKGMKKLYDAIERGDHNGKTAAADSPLKRGPESATSRAAVALRFAKRLWKDSDEDREIVLAIKSKSFASPVNVSAWSSGEYEVFTNPHSDYVVKGGRRLKENAFVLELEEL